MSLPTTFFIGRGGKAGDFDFDAIQSVGSLLTTLLPSGVDHHTESVKDIRFSPDGMICHIFPYNVQQNNDITRFDLTTPWDLRTGSFSAVTTFTNQSSYETTWNFSRDGMHLIAGGRNDVYYYSLNNPYDFSGVSPGLQDGYLSTTSSQHGNYNEDGTLYIEYRRTAKDMYVYNLSTPYDLDTATTNSSLTQTGVTNWGQDGGNIYGMQMNLSGTRLAYIDSFQNGDVHIRSLTTPYDMGTLSSPVRTTMPGLGTANLEMSLAITPNFIYTSSNYGQGQIRMYEASVSSL